ncbi:hypothetical protein NN561_016738 [Cricetulus griseus]
MTGPLARAEEQPEQVFAREGKTRGRPLTGTPASHRVVRGDCDGRGTGETSRAVYRMPRRLGDTAMTVSVPMSRSHEGDVWPQRGMAAFSKRAHLIPRAREEPRAPRPLPQSLSIRGQRPRRPAGSASPHFRSPEQRAGVRLRARLSRRKW